MKELCQCPFKIISKAYGRTHGLGDVVLVLTEAGLHIENLDDYDEIPYNVLPDLI